MSHAEVTQRTTRIRLQQLLQTVLEMYDAFVATVLVDAGSGAMTALCAVGSHARGSRDNQSLEVSHHAEFYRAVEASESHFLDRAARLHEWIGGSPDYPGQHRTLVIPFAGQTTKGAIAVDTPRRVKLAARDIRTLRNIAHIAAALVEEQISVEQKGSASRGHVAANRPLTIERSALVGRSTVWRQILNQIDVVAPTPTSVLITGETGTGKEQIARAIHDQSDRTDGPFVAVNCSVLMTELALSELFGHERGAFTGAVQRRAGRFENARGGTLFLDEIGELPLPAQAQLLRVLQDWTFQRVGGTDTITADVRLVAATHRNLIDLIASQTFRDDLYYRLNVFPIHIPPLRERVEDIRPLAEHIVDRLRQRFQTDELTLDPKVYPALEEFSWPGNVRELCNALERAAILSRGLMIQREHLNFPWPARTESSDLVYSGQPRDFELPSHLTRLERALAREILSALSETDGKISGDNGAAKLLGVPYSTLNSTIKRLGLKDLVQQKRYGGGRS